MYEMRARSGQWVIQEGEPGDRLFVVAGLYLFPPPIPRPSNWFMERAIDGHDDE